MEGKSVEKVLFFFLSSLFSFIYINLEEILFSGLTDCRANSCHLIMGFQPGNF